VIRLRPRPGEAVPAVPGARPLSPRLGILHAAGLLRPEGRLGSPLAPSLALLAITSWPRAGICKIAQEGRRGARDASAGPHSNGPLLPPTVNFQPSCLTHAQLVAWLFFAPSVGGYDEAEHGHDRAKHGHDGVRLLPASLACSTPDSDNTGTPLLPNRWISYFFAGFVLAKLPFPLTERFKAMTQVIPCRTTHPLALPATTANRALLA
jgi:hypothetical protein